MEEPGRLQSMGSRRVRHDWSDLAAAAADSFSLFISSAKSQEKKIKGVKLEKNKQNLLADDMIVFIENLKESKKMLKPVSEFNKTGDFKVNIQK